MSYSELSVTSNFTFLTGASHPGELVARAKEMGLEAIAITDRNTFAGIVRGHAASRDLGIRYIVGVRLGLVDGPDILAYPKSRKGYGHLCRLLTIGKRRTRKGDCRILLADVLEWGDDCIFIVTDQYGHGADYVSPPHTAIPLPRSGRHITDAPSVSMTATITELKASFGDNVFLSMAPRYDGNDEARFIQRAELARATGAPPAAVGDVLLHTAQRRMLADILSCIRERTTIDKLGRRALPNSERRIKSEFEIRRLFRNHPDALLNTTDISRRCQFSLDELRYEYPDEITNGMQPDDRLRQLTEAGIRSRYPDGETPHVRLLIEKELSLIADLDYARYFLTVHDIVAFARSRGILCQGRGSAANSVVCYALGITEASPDMISMVFERFISSARKEPPDIDVDFEHDRREEVIQHIYEKYGRHRAGICSTVIHFRTRAALREVGRAMGLSEDSVTALSSQVWGSSPSAFSDDRARSAGLDPSDPRLARTLALAREITGFPRHLSQHVGGFVITRGRLDELCPVENAAMEDRTIIEWDKDDIDTIGMLKIDILALGMLTCIRRSFELIRAWKGRTYTLATLPQEDPAVYDMLCVADTVGVFQVESRAQMNFLPRMRPRCFYDLVIEVAIVRPGPIQGNMIHPYIRRRRKQEAVTYPSDALKPVLEKTLGIPLFQEQAMQIAVTAAGFSPAEADQLRRALGSFRGPGTVEVFRDRFIQGCLEKGYDRSFAESCFRQLEGFSGYGFPESHAASFALLVYASSWIKRHHPEIFCCALLNSQPMGFYAPAQIIQDARRHGVTILPVCIEHSYWDSVPEKAGDGTLAVRLGFRQVRGMREEDGQWLSAARGSGYRSIEAVWRRAGIGRSALARLAAADAFSAYDLDRREALWVVQGLGGDHPLPLFREEGEGWPVTVPCLPALSPGENVFEDYVTTQLTLREHPVLLLRREIGEYRHASELNDIPDGMHISVAGLVITRQRPGTASGVIFLTLEDACGTCNIIVWPGIFRKHRKSIITGRLLKVTGKFRREGMVSHVIAASVEDKSLLLDGLGDITSTGTRINPSHDNADEARNPIPDRQEPPTRSMLRTDDSSRDENPDLQGTTRGAAGGSRMRAQAAGLFRSRDFH